MPIFRPRKKAVGKSGIRPQHWQGSPVNQAVKSVTVAPLMPAVIKIGRRDDGLERRRTTAQVTLRRGDNVVVIGVIQMAAAVADGFALLRLSSRPCCIRAGSAVGERRPAPLVADAAKGIVQGDAARVAAAARAWRVAQVEIGETAQVKEQATDTPQRQPQTSPGVRNGPMVASYMEGSSSAVTITQPGSM